MPQSKNGKEAFAHLISAIDRFSWSNRSEDFSYAIRCTFVCLEGRGAPSVKHLESMIFERLAKRTGADAKKSNGRKRKVVQMLMNVVKIYRELLPPSANKQPKPQAKRPVVPVASDQSPALQPDGRHILDVQQSAKSSPLAA